MERYTCKTCDSTGRVEVLNGPDDFETVACPDCDLGLKILQDESEGIDMTGASGGNDR